MADAPLLDDRELASVPFIRDLRSFLSLSKDVLLAIAEIGNQPEGFTGRQQAQSLNARFGVPVNQAMRDLRIAEHLYIRISELGLDDTDAISQIDSIASQIQDPVTIDDKCRDAIIAVLSFKRDYEVATAAGKALANAPHFIGANGAWGIKPVKIRSGEIIKIPVVTLSIVWHDGTGNNHEAFLQMSDRDWEEFTSKLKGLTDSRKDVDELL